MDAIDMALSPASRLAFGGPWPTGLRPHPQVAGTSSQEDSQLRQRLGEFVGSIFYGTLIRQMNNSQLKGDFFHGGRGEEVFQSQLGLELAQRLGRSGNDPITNRLYEAMRRNGVGDPELGEGARSSDPGSTTVTDDRLRGEV